MSSKHKSGGRYDVGFGKPPIHSRFKPGQSGNPRGRPKGSRNRVPSEFEHNRLRTIIDEEANRLITIQDANGKKKKIPTIQAVMRSISVNALKGHQRSQRHFTDLVGQKERAEEKKGEADFIACLDYKVAWDRELARRKSKHIGGIDPLPHPDDIVLDIQTGTARIVGPATKEEIVSWNRWRKIRALVEKELKEWHAVRDDPDCADSEELLEKLLTVIAAIEEVLRAIDLALGGSRAVMKFLEKLDLSSVKQAMQPKQKRRGAKRSYVSLTLRAAMYQEYRAQTT